MSDRGQGADPADGGQPRVPPKPFQACVACSIKKVKCDGQQPCAQCTRFFNGDCHYVARKKRGPPKGSPARGGHKSRKRTEGSALASGSQGNGGGEAATGPPKVEFKSGHDTISHASEPRLSVTVESTPRAQPSTSGSPSTSLSFGASPFTNLDLSRADLSMPGPQHPVFTPPSAISIQQPAPSPISWISPVQLPPPYTSLASQAGLTQEMISDLVMVYETFVHPLWPIVYLPSLASLHALETARPLLFDAILSIAAANTASFADTNYISSRQEQFLATGGKAAAWLEPLAASCSALTEGVRRRVLSLLYSGDSTPTLETVQSLILVALVDSGCGRSMLAYQMGGIACRMALDLGLNLQPVQDVSELLLGHGDLPTEQERLRTWWSCFVLDKIFAAILQRPPFIRLVDVDAPLPSIMERDEFDLWLAGDARHLVRINHLKTMVSTKSHSLSCFKSWCEVMAIVELVLDRIYRPSTRRAHMNDKHVEGYEESVQYIDGQLHQWRTSLPPHLQWSDDDPNAHDDVGMHLLTVRGWYFVCILLLHRPQVPYLDNGSSDAHHSPYHSTPIRSDLSILGGPLESSGDDSQKRTAPRPTKRGVEATKHAATAICTLMESYERTFFVRKYASTWVYLIFQAGTVHAGLSAHPPDEDETLQLSSSRAESARRLEQCIGWLGEISKQWSNAGHHIQILRHLSSISARTRVPSPALGGGGHSNNLLGTNGNDGTIDNTYFDMNSAPIDGSAQDPLGWMQLWTSMPAAGDDMALWRQCFPDLS